jgi:cytoskeletal protein CcmA (bactofilin family)
MTLGGFRGRGERGGIFNNGSEPRSTPARDEPTSLTAYIDKGVELIGKIRSKGSVRIDGRIKGEVRCKQTVIIGQSASVQAKIEAETAIVSGEVNGDIHATKMITLDKNARVTGNLTTPGIVIEEGARLRGQILIGVEDEAESKPAAREQSQDAAPKTSEERASGNRRRTPRTPAPSAQV